MTNPVSTRLVHAVEVLSDAGVWIEWITELACLQEAATEAVRIQSNGGKSRVRTIKAAKS